MVPFLNLFFVSGFKDLEIHGNSAQVQGDKDVCLWSCIQMCSHA